MMKITKTESVIFNKYKFYDSLHSKDASVVLKVNLLEDILDEADLWDMYFEWQVKRQEGRVIVD